jgi:hypothetical protein
VHPDNLLCCLNSYNILSLCGRQGHHGLKFTAPADCSSTHQYTQWVHCKKTQRFLSQSAHKFDHNLPNGFFMGPLSVHGKIEPHWEFFALGTGKDSFLEVMKSFFEFYSK